MKKTRQGRKPGKNIMVVRPSPLGKSLAHVQLGTIGVRAAIGRSGRTAIKREGDGATPIASMRMLYGFRRGDRIRMPAVSALSIASIRPDMLWCDQSGNPNYNRLVKAPFKPSYEEMQRKDGLYDFCLVMDWNIRSRQRNKGSAIFFHLIKPGYQPTAGCVAVSLRDMMRLLPFIGRGTTVRVV